jgi:predicted nucleotidyltransferase
VDFESGRALCAPDLVAFGTVAEFVVGLDGVVPSILFTRAAGHEADSSRRALCYHVVMRGADRDAVGAISEVFQQHPGARLAILFGSRARADGTAASDWDIGYLGDECVDRDRLMTDLVYALDTDRVDLVDLERAGGLVRFRAARDGIAVFEASPDAFERFWLEVVTFWCDAGPVIRAGYDELLAELPR